jgi:hypothetical protein
VKIPLYYHQYWKVFSDQQAQRFPPPQPWDHAIDLKPNTPAVLTVQNYPAPPAEREYWQDMIQGALEKGYV